MATLNSERITEAGLVPTKTSLDASNNFLNTGYQFIFFQNSSGVSKTITVTTQVTDIDSPLYGNITKTNSVKVVANGENCMIGPFTVDAYNDNDGLTTFAITPFSATDEVAILYL